MVICSGLHLSTTPGECVLRSFRLTFFVSSPVFTPLRWNLWATNFESLEFSCRKFRAAFECSQQIDVEAKWAVAMGAYNCLNLAEAIHPLPVLLEFEFTSWNASFLGLRGDNKDSVSGTSPTCMKLWRSSGGGRNEKTFDFDSRNSSHWLHVSVTWPTTSITDETNLAVIPVGTRPTHISAHCVSHELTSYM